jgi:3-hydroxyacyl-[acyl-carrier-protein] dehydratase
MLNNTLYKITSLQNPNHTVSATIEINKEDEIFKGHFPGQPVLPGACMLQIVKDVLESVLNVSIQLKKAEQIKFLRIVNPVENPFLELTLSYNSIDNVLFNVTADLTAKKIICFKYRGTFIAR